MKLCLLAHTWKHIALITNSNQECCKHLHTQFPWHLSDLVTFPPSCLTNCRTSSRTLQRRSLRSAVTSRSQSWIWVKRIRASWLKTLTWSSTAPPPSALMSLSSELSFCPFSLYWCLFLPFVSFRIIICGVQLHKWPEIWVRGLFILGSGLFAVHRDSELITLLSRSVRKQV